MKLLSCHIENFGKIHDFTMDFSRGTNIICENNGWGKSTFAAFIRAMFYGLEGSKKQKIEDNERKRYAPWQGGAFGGWLTFETGGKKYRVTRIFHDKDANDEFELRDAETNMESRDYSCRLGEELFQLGHDSFMRTVFIDQTYRGAETADDINAKLGNLVEDSNDINNFVSAGETLKKLAAEITPNRATGTASKRKEQIAQLQREIKDGASIEKSLTEVTGLLAKESEQYEQFKEQLKNIQEEQLRVSKLQEAFAKKGEWIRLNENLKTADRELQEARQRFPGDIPSLEEVIEKLDRCDAFEAAMDRAGEHRLSAEEESFVSSHAARFENGMSSEEEIEKFIEMAGDISGLKQKLAVMAMTEDEKQRLESLKKVYAGQESSGVGILSAKWSERSAKKTALPTQKAALSTLQAVRPEEKNNKGYVLCLVGAAVVALGILLSVFHQPVYLWGSVVAVGAVLILSGPVMAKKNRKPREVRESQEVTDMRRALDEDERFIAEVDGEVKDFLERYGKVFEEYMVPSLLAEIASEEREYAGLMEKEQRLQKDSCKDKIRELSNQTEAFLKQYGFVGTGKDDISTLYLLKDTTKRYARLLTERDTYTREMATADSVRRELEEYLVHLGYRPTEKLKVQLSQIREDISEYSVKKTSMEKAKRELETFEEGCDDKLLQQAAEAGELPSPDALAEENNRITEERDQSKKAIDNYNMRLELLQQDLDELEDKKRDLELLQETQEEEIKRYHCLVLAKKYLEKAKESMTAKYTAPLLNAFDKYYKMLTASPAEHFHLDANTKLTMDELGKQREVNTLSLGYRDLVGICMRLALVEAMYTEEKPFLLMDDPFSNFDDEKLEAARRFIGEIAGEYQIIYLTCSKARG